MLSRPFIKCLSCSGLVTAAAITCSLFAASQVLLSAQIRILPRQELDGPVLNADSSSLSFERIRVEVKGLSEDSAPVGFDFPLSNCSERKLRITHLGSSCGCVTARISKHELAPGEEAVISAIYNPKGHPGKFQRRIFVYTEASDELPAAVLYMDADVAWKEDRSTEFPFNLGNLRLRRTAVSFDLGKADKVQLRCYNAGTASISLESEQPFLGPAISASLTPAVLEPSQEGEIEIEYKPDAEYESKSWYLLMLKGTGARPSESSIKIEIQ